MMMIQAVQQRSKWKGKAGEGGTEVNEKKTSRIPCGRGQSTCEKLSLTDDKKKWRTLVTLKLVWRKGTGVSYTASKRCKRHL